MSLLFFSTAYAEASGAPVTQGGSPWTTIIMLVVFFIIFYFLLIRPQAKRAKEHRAMLSHLVQGDEVVTSGGLAGKIFEIEETFLILEIATNVKVRIQKGSIGSVLPKGTLKF